MQVKRKKLEKKPLKFARRLSQAEAEIELMFQKGVKRMFQVAT